MALRAVAEVNLAAIERNAARLCARIGAHVRLCAVVKADGYGHGAVPSARAALRGGAVELAVATAAEAGELRRAGLSEPILVLGAISAEELPDAVMAGAELTVWDPAFVSTLRSQARARQTRIGVHVKLDSGLGRLGTRDARQALELVREVVASPELHLSGVMTHLATADGDLVFASQQLDLFDTFEAEARALASTDITAHAANSAATLRLDRSHFDMVRAGIALYGGDPMNRDPADHQLEPALTLRTYVAALKPIAVGESTGYGRRFISQRESVIATIPIGYGDGLVRALANNCDVLIGGRRYPLCGMVSMDNITVDVGPEPPLRVGDPVTLIGVDGAERQTAEDLAQRIGTISYEAFCLISKRVPRLHHRDGVPVDGAHGG